MVTALLNYNAQSNMKEKQHNTTEFVSSDAGKHGAGGEVEELLPTCYGLLAARLRPARLSATRLQSWTRMRARNTSADSSTIKDLEEKLRSASSSPIGNVSRSLDRKPRISPKLQGETLAKF